MNLITYALNSNASRVLLVENCRSMQQAVCYFPVDAVCRYGRLSDGFGEFSLLVVAILLHVNILLSSHIPLPENVCFIELKIAN